MLIQSMGEQPEMMERLLFARNRKWIAPIEMLIAAGEPAIVIVGMGHLIGEGSVVELLRERGYTVTQLVSESRVGAAGPVR